MEEKKLVLMEIEGEVALLILNNPEKLNALSLDMIQTLFDSLKRMEENNVRVAIITGAGKAFCAGADINYMSNLDPQSAYKWARMGHELMDLIERSPQIYIAAINGYALGGGMELAMACDLRIASRSAQFGQPEVHLGLIPGFGGTQRLSKIVGFGWAKRLILTGERIDAQTAYNIGIVEEVVEDSELLIKARELANKILRGGPTAIKLSKEIINKSRNMPFNSGCEYESQLFGLIFSTGEPQVGLKAFLKKEKPDWVK